MKFRSLTRLTLFLFLVFSAFGSGRAAQLPDDRYVSIYASVNEADALNVGGKREEALKKYREAHTALLELKRAHPGWNTKVVAFRLNELSSKIAALSQPAPEATPAANPAQAGKAQDSKGGLKILSTGAEPKKVLRFHPEPGQTQTAVLTIKASSVTQVPGVPVQNVKSPAVELTIQTTVKSVAENGDIAFESVMKDVKVIAQPGGAPELTENISQMVTPLKGRTAASVVSSRGVNKKTQPEEPEKERSESEMAISQLEEMLSDMAMELPEEAVGIGARWEKRRPVKSDGIKMTQVAVYEIVLITGDEIVITGLMTQTAGSQKVPNAAGASVKVDITRVTGSGTDNSTWNLTRLLPVYGKGTMTSETVMSVTAAGRKQSMVMKRDMEMEMKSQ